MGWLDAVSNDKDPRTNREKLPPGDPLLEIPEVQLPYMLDYFAELRLVDVVPGGLLPLSWQTIHSWATITKTNLSPEEAKLLVRMSEEYVRSWAAKEPYPPGHQQPEKDINDQIKSFAALFKKKRGAK